MAKEEANKEEEMKEKDYEDWHNSEWRKKYWMKHHHHGHYSHGGNAVYFFGFIGALVYYWQHANTFWMIVMGLVQSIVWPAILVWHLFTFLKL